MRSRLKKRGQGMYILIGAVIFMVVIFGLYTYSSRLKQKSEEEKNKVLEESIIPSLKLYMTHSIEQASIDPIKEIGVHGGTFDPNPNAWKGAIKIGYTCYKVNPSNACINTLVTRQYIEKQLADKILSNLNKDLDLTRFREQGIDITEGSREVKVILGKTAVVVELHYPLELRVKNEVEKIDMFQSTIDIPLGILYDLSVLITNTETQEKEFNIIEWYQKHPDLFITIDCEKTPAGTPNEEVCQLVKDEFAYNFALQKTDLQPSQYGCCYNKYDFMCFKNVPKEKCDEIGGEYDPNPLCYCPTEGRLSCVASLPKAGCVQDYVQEYTEVLKLSDYENAHASLPGTPGFDISICCSIVAFYITQQPDIIGTDCGTGALFAKLSSTGNAHVDEPGDAYSTFSNDACISAQKNTITCIARSGNCLGEEDPVISLTEPVNAVGYWNAHAGYSYRYNEKICCKADKIS